MTTLPRQPQEQSEATRPASGDVVIAPGLSVHLYGNRVGIFCSRIDSARGFVEMPLRDLLAIVSYFSEGGAGRVVIDPKD